MNRILVIGSSLDDKGGIATVMSNIKNSFLNKEFSFFHITTYKTANIIRKLIIYIVGIINTLLHIRKCDAVHIHMSYKGSFYRKSIIILLIKIFNKPIIIHVHGSCFKEFYNNLGKISKSYCNFIFNKVDKVIVLSQSWKDFFSTFVDKDRIVVIHNSVRISKKQYNINKKLKSKIEFLFLGRLGKRKGIYDLLEVTKKLQKEHCQNFKLIIAGDGEVEKVSQIIENENLTKNVENIGWIDGRKKEELLEKADVFILPSYNEGLPMSILEAMSFHIPCITTNVGGIPEVVENEKNGFIIEPGNKEGLYNCMLKMLNNKEKVKNMGDEAFETVKSNFNEEKELLKLEKLYFDLIKKGGSNEKNKYN